MMVELLAPYPLPDVQTQAALDFCDTIIDMFQKAFWHKLLRVTFSV